jgi:hypothetical protein
VWNHQGWVFDQHNSSSHLAPTIVHASPSYKSDWKSCNLLPSAWNYKWKRLMIENDFYEEGVAIIISIFVLTWTCWFVVFWTQFLWFGAFCM